MMRARWAKRILAAILLVSSAFLPASSGADEPTRIRFGTLPVLQALPLYVAEEKGYFDDWRLKVELIPFNSAAEKDLALSTGSVDGVFADLVTPVVLKGNGQDVAIVATNYDTRKDRRMFGVMGRPGGEYASVTDLAGVPIAVSSNSVIDYVTEKLLTSAGVPKERMETVEVKNIGLRFQMLLTGRIEAATLPEPLVTAALAKGAKLLADDADLATSQTVLVFAGPFIREHGAAVEGFLAAVDKANKLIDTDPDSIRPVMVEHVRLPPPLKATYPVPKFPVLHPPDRPAVAAIVDWLKERDVLPRKLEYREIVHVGHAPSTDSVQRGR